MVLSLRSSWWHCVVDDWSGTLNELDDELQYLILVDCYPTISNRINWGVAKWTKASDFDSDIHRFKSCHPSHRALANRRNAADF